MTDVWHYTNEGKRMEPVTAGELRQLAGTGFLRPDDLVWREGMANWAAASTVKGLFSATTAPAPAETRPASFESERSERRERPDIDEDRPRRRRRSADDDDRPRRRRPVESKGPNLVLIFGLLGGGVFVLLVIGVGITAAVSRRPVRNANAPQMQFPPAAMQMAPGPVGAPVEIGGGTLHRTLPTLGGGQQCEFTVTYPIARGVNVHVDTIERIPDVDLYVLEMGTNRQFADTTFGPDCQLFFQAQAGRTYRFQIRNISMQAGVANSTITYTAP